MTTTSVRSSRRGVYSALATYADDERRWVYAAPLLFLTAYNSHQKRIGCVNSTFRPLLTSISLYRYVESLGNWLENMEKLFQRVFPRLTCPLPYSFSSLHSLSHSSVQAPISLKNSGATLTVTDGWTVNVLWKTPPPKRGGVA